MKIDIREFERWFEVDESVSGEPVPGDITAWVRQGHQSAESYVSNVISADRRSRKHVSLSGNTNDIPKSYQFSFPESSRSRLPSQDEVSDISHLDVRESLRYAKLEIQNGTIKEIVLTAKAEARFESCIIGTLRINKPGSNRHEVWLKNCWIGRLILASDSVETFDVKGGGIFDIRCPVPDEPGPFRGNVDFSEGVTLPVSAKESALYRGPQSYRNLRSHIEKLQNFHLTNYFRAKEMAANADPKFGKDVGFNLFINFLYRWLSGYGESASRPLIWILSCWIIAGAVVYGCDDGGRIGLADTQYIGARATLNHPECGRLARSAFLPIEATFNPLGAFNSRPLVVTNSWPVATLVRATGLISDILIFLSILAIRRRFKLP